MLLVFPGCNRVGICSWEGRRVVYRYLLTGDQFHLLSTKHSDWVEIRRTFGNSMPTCFCLILSIIYIYRERERQRQRQRQTQRQTQRDTNTDRQTDTDRFWEAERERDGERAEAYSRESVLSALLRVLSANLNIVKTHVSVRDLEDTLLFWTTDCFSSHSLRMSF